MTTWSTEELIDSTIEMLGANLGPALDAIYAANAARDLAAGRSIAYTAPLPGLAELGGDYHSDAASTILRYPAVEVSIPDLRMENFDIGLTDSDASENLVVLVWEQSADLPTLARKLRRLLAAAYDVILTGGTIAGGNIETVRAAWRWNPETNDRDEITSGGLLVFGLASTRTRP